jgi:dihydroorotase
MAKPTPTLILRGGRVIDPGAGRDEVADVVIAGDRILAVEANMPAIPGAEIIDVSGKLVTPGLIDTHSHIYQHVTGRFGLNPDMVGVRSGVTTLVDQGGPSSMTIPGFRNFIVEPAASRVLCFISAYVVGGLEGHYYPELYGPGGVDVAATVKAAKANADIVKGVKAHAEIGGASRWGLEVIKLGKQIAAEAAIPLYIHLGQLWPTKTDATVDADALVAELLPIMEAGDILAHPFTRHPGGFISAETGELHPLIRQALDRGVAVDVGHGSHFSFAMARKVLAEGILPQTLGADLHGYNVSVPGASSDPARQANPFFGVAPFCLTHAMSELLALGVSLKDVIATVTSNPARMLGMADEIGSLKPGMAADISVLDLLGGRFALRDNSGETVIAEQLIVPAQVVRAGRVRTVDSPLVPPLAAYAA